MTDFKISTELAEKALMSARFDLLGKLGIDVATIATWDPTLSRSDRILVPVDVQAYVVPAGGAPEEPTLDLTGNREADPAPFADGRPREAGVHLHWAMPDSLLIARTDTATKSPVLRVLPDQWVVVRTLQPNGGRQLLATGWVVDARTRTVTALRSYTGPGGVPDGQPQQLDGFTFGVEWTASYGGARGRFTFHDALDDLEALGKAAPHGFAGDQAVYTVAGWWSDDSRDPLTPARGTAALDAVLSGLGWRVDHDADDAARQDADPDTQQRHETVGLNSATDSPKTRVVGRHGGYASQVLEDIDIDAGYAVTKPGMVFVGDTLPRYHSLLHGSVLGVPIGGRLPNADDRPDPGSFTVALGSDLDDVVAALGADGIGLPEDDRRAAEDLLAAFSSGLVTELGTSDGLDTLADREHSAGFWSLPGTPLPGAHPDRLRAEDSLPTNPFTVGRKGRAARAGARDGRQEEPNQLRWRGKVDLQRRKGAKGTARATRDQSDTGTPAGPTSREVVRAAPRYFRPAPPVLAVRNARPHQRHHGDGRYDDQGKLLCRYPRAAVTEIKGVITGAQVLPTLGNGATPPEVTTVVREAALLNPYGGDWLAAAAAPEPEVEAAYGVRVAAEMVRLYGAEGRYDGSSHVDDAEDETAVSKWERLSSQKAAMDLKLADAFARFAILVGQPPSPVAITTWRQPWVPLWVEWRVTLTGSATVEGWLLEGYDLEPPTAPANDVSTTLDGRSLLGQGVGETLRQAVTAWATSEKSRQATAGRSAHGAAPVVQKLADFERPLDMVSASLDGIREQLLGIDYVGTVRRQGGKPVAGAPPVPLFGGRLRLDGLRIVDAFGRYLAVPDEVLDALRSTLELEVDEEPRSITLRPRIQNAARWLFRLVDPGQLPATQVAEVREAYVDQVSQATAVNPVAGFLLPDHIDEGLEAFTVSGDPIGQLAHDVLSGAVGWEPAPGRPVPPDAGPLVDLAAQERIVGEIAAGLVRADAAARDLPEPPEASALVTFLRAVDSTLWTVDAFASLGSNTLAGLVGRPIAVVRAILSLDAPDDVAEVTVTDSGGAPARTAAYDELVEEEFEVRLGTLTRTDNTLLGFYLDDDYERLHLVDRVVAEHARITGRQTGQLGLLGAEATAAVGTLDHPYLSTQSRIRLRRGQTRRLTLLMVPGGRVHLTSGVLPRKELQLADSWFTAGLAKLMPSVRVGPVLVDPGEIRLPLVAVLGDRQTFTRRTGELTWRDDAILAATQTAYLPRAPHEVQEGWIRVTPAEGAH